MYVMHPSVDGLPVDHRLKILCCIINGYFFYVRVVVNYFRAAYSTKIVFLSVLL